MDEINATFVLPFYYLKKQYYLNTTFFAYLLPFCNAYVFNNQQSSTR